MSKIECHEGGIEQFSRGYERFGFNESPDGSISFAEWCPGALRVSVVGDFSLLLDCSESYPLMLEDGWNREAHPCVRDSFGIWSVTLPPTAGQPLLQNGSKVKVCFFACGMMLT